MKQYNQPTTEIMAFNTERMMDDFTMSPRNDGPGSADAPARRGTLSPD